MVGKGWSCEGRKDT